MGNVPELMPFKSKQKSSREKLSKDQNESTESRDSTTTNTQTTTPVNPPNYRFSIYNNPWSSARKRKRRDFAEPFPAFHAEYTYLPICFNSAHVLYLSCNFKS
jgi:hypothetical protein